MTAPIALELIEDALHTWVAASMELPGERVIFEEPLDSGAPEPAMPFAQIAQLGAPLALSQPAIQRVPAAVIQRVTVIANGPGEVGVLFYLGFAEAAQVIAYTAAAAEAPASSAIGLLAELVADLPAGVTAIIDPADPASVQILGSASEPLFASSPVDVALTAVTTLRERFGELECTWTRMVWRVTTHSEAVRGFGTAGDLSTRALMAIQRRLAPLALAIGWRFKGTPLQTSTTEIDRGESTAILDVALEGWATAAYQDTALRLVEPMLETG